MNDRWVVLFLTSLRLLFETIDVSRSPSAWDNGAFCCGHVDEKGQMGEKNLGL